MGAIESISFTVEMSELEIRLSKNFCKGMYFWSCISLIECPIKGGFVKKTISEKRWYFFIVIVIFE